MSRANDGGPAFPVPPNETEQQNMGWERCPTGMSVRDWFAGQALVALAENETITHKDAAEHAYRYADAMLAARNEQPTA